jgi:hypothetical protein
MTYFELLELTQKGLSIRGIAVETGYSYSTVRYWLKRHGIQTRPEIVTRKIARLECKCGETDPQKFYGRKFSVCGKCHNEYTKKKGLEVKKKVIDYMGGSCSECGYSGPPCTMDLHHIDRSKKDPNFSCFRYWSWDRICKELKNCKLLCAICHRLAHQA